MTFRLPFGQSGRPMPAAAAQQRSKYLTDAMSALQESSQDIRSSGELGSRLLAEALLKWGRDRADKAAGGGGAPVPTAVDFAGRTSFDPGPVRQEPGPPPAAQPAGLPPTFSPNFQPVTRRAPAPFGLFRSRENG